MQVITTSRSSTGRDGGVSVVLLWRKIEAARESRPYPPLTPPPDLVTTNHLRCDCQGLNWDCIGERPEF